MNHSSVSAATMLNEFLRISAPESVRLGLKRQYVNIRDLFEEIQAAAPDWTQGKPVALHLKIEPDTPDVLLDKIHIRQTITTLLAIAAQYADPEAVITLSARQVLRLVVFSVLYPGHGIPEEEISNLGRTPEIRPRVAEKKSSLESGLARVRDTVQAHLGHVWVEDGVDEYTTFSFILPVND